MGYVAKGSPLGFDVKQLKDYLQSFNSSWPHLKIGLQGNFTGTVTHNLGYPPVFLLGTAKGQVDQSASSFYSVSNTTLSRSSGSGTPRYYICRLPLNVNYTAPIEGTGTSQSAASNNYSIKVTTSGKNTSSTDMRDFALNSNTIAPLVHKVATALTVFNGGTSSFEVTVSHGLSYVPLVLVFASPGANTAGHTVGEWFTINPAIGTADQYYQVTNTSVYVNFNSLVFTQAPTVSIVVLKNPFTLNTISRTYP